MTPQQPYAPQAYAQQPATHNKPARGKIPLRIFSVIWIVQICIGLFGYILLRSGTYLPYLLDRFLSWVGVWNLLWPFNYFLDVSFLGTLIVSVLLLAGGGILILIGSDKRQFAGFTIAFAIVVAVITGIDILIGNIILPLDGGYFASNVIESLLDLGFGLLFGLICPLILLIGGILNKKSNR